MKRYERRAAKRYAHMVCRERPCWRLVGGFCLRCAWRKVNGSMAREKAARAARFRELAAIARACSHENREPPRNPSFAWHCADCHTSKWIGRAS